MTVMGANKKNEIFEETSRQKRIGGREVQEQRRICANISCWKRSWGTERSNVV